MHPSEALSLCRFPEHLHPVSQQIMQAFFDGLLNQAEFLRYFSLPNSDYIPLARCLVEVLLA